VAAASRLSDFMRRAEGIMAAKKQAKGN